ncbi:MAG TPA: DUF3352 domain-containing protein [Pyrinomonadaceae bacterium]|nr:DUF3352 domain-containing protein [Pyrinomonadaceae bacterium]
MERLKSKGFILFAAAVLVVAGVAAAVEVARPTKAENPRLERLLPADTVGFVEVTDLRAQALKVIESEAWREFSKENSAASSLFMIGANHAGTLDASYALALLGVAPNADGKPEPQFVIVGQFNDWGSRYTFENRVLRFVKDGQSKGVEAKTEEVDGARLVTVRRNGVQRFTYATKDTLLVVSNTEAAVRRVLDVRAQRTPSLESNDKFKQARAGSGAVDGMFGFLDGAALTRIVDSVPADDEAGRHVAAFKQLFHGLGGASVQSAGFTSTFEDGRVVERFNLVAPTKEGVLATVASNPPTEQKLLALVPDTAVQAFDASVANAPQTFDQLIALASQLSEQSGKKGPADALAEFTEKTGVDFRNEIVGAVGTELCAAQLTAAGSDEGPSGVIIVNLKDEAAFAGALAKFAEKNGRALTEREYKGVKVQRIAGEKGGGLEYAFAGGNLVASGKPSAVERVIDTAQGGHSLKESAAYKSASAQLQTPAQFVYFNSNTDYLNRLGRTLQGGEQEFKTEGQRATLRPSFAFGVAQPDGFFVESRTPLGTFPRLLTTVTSRLGGEKKDGGAE